jgi:hypothetical protein
MSKAYIVTVCPPCGNTVFDKGVSAKAGALCPKCGDGDLRSAIGALDTCECGKPVLLHDTPPGMPKVYGDYCQDCNDNRAEVVLAPAPEPVACCDDVCEECCEHGDTDDYACLDCGKELLEDRMCAAYDRAKDARKYGDL